MTLVILDERSPELDLPCNRGREGAVALIPSIVSAILPLLEPSMPNSDDGGNPMA